MLAVSQQYNDDAFDDLTDEMRGHILLSALVTATQAQVAATVLLTEVIAAAADVTSPDLDAWRKVIPADFSAWKKES